MPLFRRLSGGTERPTPWHGVSAGFAHRKKPGLREYLRVRLTQRADGTLRAERCGGDGSAMLASLAASDGLVLLTEDQTGIREGDLLPYAPFAELESA
jgi:molybdopterin molybdotransferase